jgi:hypothetical protein
MFDDKYRFLSASFSLGISCPALWEEQAREEMSTPRPKALACLGSIFVACIAAVRGTGPTEPCFP